MAQYTLTVRQRSVIGDLFSNVLADQEAATQALARRDRGYTKLEDALREFGHTAGLPSPITNATRPMNRDGTWGGKVGVTG